MCGVVTILRVLHSPLPPYAVMAWTVTTSFTFVRPAEQKML